VPDGEYIKTMFTKCMHAYSNRFMLTIVLIWINRVLGCNLKRICTIKYNSTQDEYAVSVQYSVQVFLNENNVYQVYRCISHYNLNYNGIYTYINSFEI